MSPGAVGTRHLRFWASLGDIIRVKVLEVDIPRKRISLTLRLDDEVGPRAGRAGAAAPCVATDVVLRRVSHLRNSAPQRREEQATGTLAEALRRAGLAERRK
jgi:protein Tex